MLGLLDNLEETIIIIDKLGNIKYSNAAAKKLFNIKNNDNIISILKKDDREIFFKNLIHIVEKQNKYSNFMRFIKKDKSLVLCWLNVFENNKDIVFEIFDLTKAETRNMNIKDDNYVKLLKYMSEGIAHSIRNPVMSAGGILNRLKTKLPKDTPNSVISYIEIVEKSLFRIMHIIANIEVISNSLPTTLKQVNLGDIAKRLIEKYKKNENIEFILQEEEGVEVFADDLHITFVLEEIVKNSIEAINVKKGTIKIEIKKLDERAVVTISDNGAGMSEEDMPLIMIPFYSTKPSNMGVGLSLSKFITEGYGGEISISSSVGEGTKVTITLPTEKRNILRREALHV